MPFASTFEDLTIWQDARVLVRDIYLMFRESPVAQKDPAFVNHILRASISVTNNIAEGFERSSKLDFARFLDIAKGSCGEVRSMMYLASDLGYVEPEPAEDMIQRLQVLSRQIAAMTKTLRPGKPADKS